MLEKAGIIVSSEVNPEGRPSDMAFRPLTKRTRGFGICMLEVVVLCVLSLQDKTSYLVLPFWFESWKCALHPVQAGNVSREWPLLAQDVRGERRVFCHSGPHATGLC